MQFTTILAFMALFVCAYTQNNNVTVRDLKLFVNSQEFFIKAVAYNPVPLGYQNMTSELMGGGGYCSPLQDMWTNWNSACYDSDYYSTTTGAPGASAPSNGWFTNLWIRDFPILKAMGTNTLRLYNANPSTAAATTLYSNIFLTGYGKNHTAFMDYAQQWGFKIIFPLIGDGTLMANTAADVYKRYIMWQIDEIGNHPALLMYTLGNELDLNSNPSLLASVNLYIGFARSYQLLKWGREIPITSAVVDLPNSYNYLAANLEVDVFTTNAGYRGISFTDLWSGNSITEGWWNLSCRYNKPVFIGEIGWQAINNSIMQSIPNWFNQIWLDAINHIDQGCIGGTFFEYNDEPYSKAAVDQQTMGVVSFEVSIVNGVSSLQQFAWNPDTAVLKEIYSYVANGTTPDGVYSNFNTNVFQLIGRAPYTLSTLPSTSICAANFTLKSCPTDSDYDCSGNGICDYWVGTCSCGVGWSGAGCSVGTCAGSATCSGNGQCLTDLSPPFCVCDDGSDGATCGSLQASNSCPIGAGWSTACANGNGICNNSTWTCTCHPGWTGYACSIPTASTIIVSTSTGQISTGSSSTGTNPSSTGANPSSSTGSNPSSTVNSASSTTGSDDETSSTGTFGTSSSTGSAHGNSAVSVAPTFAAILLLLVSLLM